ncbi:hypothetical protein ACTFIU_000138 [Dictyostelium citrinum]
MKEIDSTSFNNILKLIKQLGKPMVDELINAIKRENSLLVHPYPGAIWISTIEDGKVKSFYYHPTKSHSATTIGRLGTKTSIADPGEWAVSQQTKALFGNKTHYKTL